MDVSVVVICKRERSLDETLGALEKVYGDRIEIVVVDASGGELADVQARHRVRWIDFVPPPGVRVSIPHQRNVGVRTAQGRFIVFIDAGCTPEPGWLDALTAPLVAGDETVTAGPVSRSESVYTSDDPAAPGYVEECPTINMAFLRSAFDQVDGFDETFEYGSDIDFSWRLRDAGHRIRWVPEAGVRHDWGGRARQARRSYAYGQARSKLYLKHRRRWRQLLRQDPQVTVYPLFIALLPVTLRHRWYPLLLLIPLYRARASPAPLAVVEDHLLYGLGGLAHVTGLYGRLRR